MKDLGNYARCEICGKYGWTGVHKCPPIWTCFEIDEYGTGSKRTIYARDAEEAAGEYAAKEDCESADYTFLHGGGKVGLFRQDDPGDILIYEVTGQLIPEYSAEAIEDSAAVKLVREERKEEEDLA
jgi:hypothetical protein